MAEAESNRNAVCVCMCETELRKVAGPKDSQRQAEGRLPQVPGGLSPAELSTRDAACQAAATHVRSSHCRSGRCSEKTRRRSRGPEEQRRHVATHIKETATVQKACARQEVKRGRESAAACTGKSSDIVENPPRRHE